MKTTNALRIFFLVATVVALPASLVSAHEHSGDLDRYGCYHDRDKGNYHCSRGRYKGRTFTSESEMLGELDSEKDVPSDSESRLQQLNELHARKLISDEEYAEKRAEILDEL